MTTETGSRYDKGREITHMKGFRTELENNILSFWKDKMVDEEYGGFYGKMDMSNRIHRTADKGAVMIFRVLWTYSAAYRVLGNETYRDMAERAYLYGRDFFMDTVHGGVYWTVDYRGRPADRKKQLYAQAFALYAITEYYRITKEAEALTFAMELFEQIEKGADRNFGGYVEAFAEDWMPLSDMRLSEKDQNVEKTMNTHLHIMEAYSNLMRIHPVPRVARALKMLVDTFITKIYNSKSGHLGLFFDKNWQKTSNVVSFGHDIEAAWLLQEAVDVLDDSALIERFHPISMALADAASEGLLSDGSLAYERHNGSIDAERHWWVQAEAVVGFSYMEQLCPQQGFKEKSERVWEYIKDQLVDAEHGEWYWSRLADGSINKCDDKAGFWKCPYHNGRMCLELIENFEKE